MDRRAYAANQANIAAAGRNSGATYKPTQIANPYPNNPRAQARYGALQTRMNREGFGASSSGRESGGVLAGSPDFRSKFERAMSDVIQRKDVGNEDPTQRINMAADRIAQSEGGASAELQKRAAAGGYGTGGGIQAGLQGLYENFATQKADSARGITQDVSESNAAANRAEDNRLLQALGVAEQQMSSDRAHALSLQELELRQRAQAFAQQQMQQDRAQAKQNKLVEALAAINAGGGAGEDRRRDGWDGVKLIGGGALDELAKRQATGKDFGAAMDRLDKIIDR